MCSLKESLAPFDGVEETTATAPPDSGADAGVELELYPIWDNKTKPAKTVAPDRKIRRIGVNVETKKEINLTCQSTAVYYRNDIYWCTTGKAHH